MKKLAAVFVLLFAAACGGAPAKPAGGTDLSGVTIRFAEQVKGTSTLLDAAGELKNVPYKIEWSEFTAAAPQLQALGAGAADVAFSGDAPAINAVAAGLPLKLIAAVQPINSEGYDGLSILVKKNSPVKSVADLRGRTISPTTAGSIGHQVVLAALAQANIPVSAVKIAPLGPADARAAFNSGAIDAWATWDPYVATEQLKDDARILVNSKGLSPRYGFVEATQEALKDPGRHAAIQDLLQRIARANAWAEQNTAKWATVFATAYNTDPAVAQLMMTRYASKFVPVDAKVKTGLQGIADLYLKNGVISQPVSVDKAFDNSFTVPAS